MDGKKGGKGRGFERYLDKGGKGHRLQGGSYVRNTRDTDASGRYGRDGQDEKRRPFEKNDRYEKKQGEKSFRPHRDGDRFSKPSDGRRYDEARGVKSGPGPRFSRAPQRPVPPAVSDDAPQGARYARPVRPAGGMHNQRFEGARYDKAVRPRESGPRMDAPPRYANPVPPEAEAHEEDNLLVGRNPIREALKAGKSIEKMLVAQGELSGSARELVAKAREAGIVVQFVDRARLDAVYPNHQGMLAYASAAAYSSVEDILALAAKKGESPFIVALDGVTDPHNLGAIIRSAECCGAHGVLVPERRSAGLNPAAVKAAAGALSYLPVARVGNLSRALLELKEKGLWVTGCDMSGEDIKSADLTGPVVLVIGSEGDGISHLVLENCDRVVSIPLKGSIPSLNASVAAGIALYEVMRARIGQ